MVNILLHRYNIIIQNKRKKGVNILLNENEEIDEIILRLNAIK